MFSILADVIFTATRNDQRHSHPQDDWADRFVPRHRRQDQMRDRVASQRTLW